MDLSPADLQKDIHEALKLWHSLDQETSPFTHLYLFQQATRHSGTNRQATNHLLLEGLTGLEAAYSDEARLLRLRFLDEMTMQAAANQLNLAQSTANRKQRQAMEHLAVILAQREEQARQARQTELAQQLDLPPATPLIGVQPLQKRLLDFVTDPDAPWLISVEGLGGIGKTALANALVRELAFSPRFERLAWVSAKQQEFLPGLGLHATGRPALEAESLVDALLTQLDPAASLGRPPQARLANLTDRLKEQPVLAVIDNLETVADYQALLPTLRQLINPSKFLLTSRHSLRAHSDVAPLTVTELSQADAFNFLRCEAQTRRLTALLEAEESHLAAIYQVTGGNPLALKLVAGQIGALPLSTVLESLTAARGKKVEDLYTHIYWQAWNTLQPAARQLLLTMPLAQNGTIEQLRQISGLALDPLQQALEELIDHSLLEQSGGLDQRRYRIHRLTESFLLNEVAKWDNPAP